MILAFVLVVSSSAEVPEPLKPWVGWVLQDKRAELCPYLNGHGDQRHCAWPAVLDLTLDKKQGSFTQKWTVDADGFVALPGDSKHWPLDVKVDGQGALVTDRSGEPVMELKPGTHTVTGRFAWDTLPESLAVPDETGLVLLTVNGKRVRAPEREDGGTLYLQKEESSAEEEEANRFDVVVHRRIDDDIPLRITTNIELFVSGKAREVVIGPALPQSFVPMALRSPIPARVEPNGTIRLQVRPGRWTLSLEARGGGEALKPAVTTEDNWPQEEVWVFQSNASLRLVEIEGVDAIDPAQTTLPAEWKKLPAYRVRAKETLKLAQKRRGDEEPSPDQLSLERNVWLDFDGNGYTFSDTITGEKARGDRLEMPLPAELGRASLAGADQFITRLPSARGPGVETGKGSVKIVADSRLNGDARNISAVSWAQDFKKVRTTLHLPPGWKLLSVSGADDVPDTWFRNWSLVELFLVMLTTFGFARLFGLGAGVLACVALVLAVPEPDAPATAWLVVLAFETLLRVVPSAAVKNWLRVARTVSWVGLALVLVPFLVTQLRLARYPVLENEWQRFGDAPGADHGGMTNRPAPAMAQQVANQMALAEPEEDAPQDEDGRGLGGLGLSGSGAGGGGDGAANADQKQPMARMKKADKAYNSLATKAPKKQRLMSQNLYEHDPKAIVQTGPGLPAWNWKQHKIGFSGPVTQEQMLHLYLLSPLANFLLGFSRVAALLMLFAVVLGLPGSFWPRGLRRWFVPAVFLLLPLKAQAAEFPSSDMLEQLEERLLKPADCAPNCASSGRMVLEAQGNSLRMRVEISAAITTAVPLPAGEKQWLPERITLDGKPVEAMLRDESGVLWLRITPGAHQVILEGSLPERDTVQIPLPLKPHYVEAKTTGWSLDGLHEDGQADDDLQLSRVQKGDKKETGATLEAGVLPPFVRVERTFELGLSWQVETRIVRLTPTGSAVVLEVPLVEGESVTTADVRVDNGRALVNMGAQETERSWRSVLKERAEVALAAKKDALWVEQWRVSSSPVWHVDAKGIPPVHGAAMTFRPWPGESLTLTVTRPEGAQGQSLTIDKSVLNTQPGARATDSTLTLTVRSSRGGQHSVKLPPGAELQTLSVAGQSQPLRQQGDVVSFAVTPGVQTVSLAWRSLQGTDFVTPSPVVDLNVPSVNATLEVQAPRDRWLLWARGEGIGPAILFYPTLLFLLFASLFLARLPYAPLKWWQWLLLGLGLTQVDVSGAFVVAGWFLLLGARKRYIATVSHPLAFNVVQAFIAGWSFAMVIVLFWAIKNGLLVNPDMQVSGNGSSGTLLRFFSDRRAGSLPQASFYSVPLFVFRAFMLAWSLWLARAFLSWLTWAWTSFSHGGLLMPLDWWRPWRWFRR